MIRARLIHEFDGLYLEIRTSMYGKAVQSTEYKDKRLNKHYTDLFPRIMTSKIWRKFKVDPFFSQPKQLASKFKR